MTPEQRLRALLADRQVRRVHVSGALRRTLGISKKAAARDPRLRAHRDLPGSLLIAEREGARDNVHVWAYDEEGEAFARAFARAPDWGRLGL